MPGDTDISHEVEARLVAIEARLDALEGNDGENGDGEDNGNEEASQLPVEEVPEVAPSRRGRRSYGTTTEETVTETES